MAKLTQKKILIIEDEKPLARLLELALKHEGYDIKNEYDGKKGLHSVSFFEPDLILLDIMLPEIDGMEVCRKIREFSYVPIIMLTARDETEDKVAGLDFGANDYITKPFDMDELLARIRAALRNNKKTDKSLSMLIVKDLCVDISSHTVKRADTPVSLTKREFDLLQYLIKNRGIVLTRDQILDKVWGIDYEGEANVVDVYIRYLRSKIDEPFESKLIHTVRGVGYVLDSKSPNN